MNRYILIIISALSLCACSNADRRNKHIEPLSNDRFLQDVNDSTQTTRQILDKYLSSVVALARADTAVLYYESSTMWEDSVFRQILIGKPLGKTAIIATEVNLKDTVINFYCLDKENWKLIGSEKTNIPVFKIDFEDLDGDNKNEIVTSTIKNMNGNTWQEVYYYSEQANTIKYAGSFSSDYVVKKDR